MDMFHAWGNGKHMRHLEGVELISRQGPAKLNNVNGTTQPVDLFMQYCSRNEITTCLHLVSDSSTIRGQEVGTQDTDLFFEGCQGSDVWKANCHELNVVLETWIHQQF